MRGGMEKRNLFILFILGVIVLLTSCNTPTGSARESPTSTSYEHTQPYDNTAGATTATAGVPVNTETIPNIVATQYAEGTKMAASMTANPTHTPIPPTVTIPASSDLCKSSDLKSEVIQGSPATGGLFLFYMVLTNISDKPCFLQGWPDVQFLDRQHQLLEVDYGYYDPYGDNQSAVATKRVVDISSLKVGLYPRSSVNINMGWRNWCGSKLDEGIIIRLTLIDGKEMIDVPTDVKAFCDYPGNPSEVIISRFMGVVNTTPTSEKY